MKLIFAILLPLITVLNIFSQTWIEQTSNVTATLTSVSVDGSYYPYATAWICGYTGVVLRTTNNGINWVNKSGNGIPSTVSLINILGIDSATALTAGYIGSNTFVYKTTNGGNSWTQVFTETGGFINAICKLYSSGLLMQGDPVSTRWSLWKSTNNGTTWDSAGLYLLRNGTETGYNNSMWASIYNTRVWFGTNNYRIYYTTNNGSNWTVLSTQPEQHSYAVWFTLSQTDGLFGGANMMKTSNYGSNWSPVSTLGTGNFGGISGTPLPVDNLTINEMVYYVRSDNKIYRSSWDATNWQVTFTAPNGTYRYIGGYPLFGPFWAVRNNGGISYSARLGGINQLGSEIPESYSLKQNYPNPFNPSTTILFDLPKSSFVNLKVYNSLGAEIDELVNEKLGAGKYEYKYNAAGLTSGVYFYTLESEGYRETKKMVVLK